MSSSNKSKKETTYTAVTHHTTTVVVSEAGCCGPLGRVQWVAGLNIVVGILELINGILYMTGGRGFMLFGGIGITAGILLISAGSALLAGIYRRIRACFTAWIVLISLYILLELVLVGCYIYYLVVGGSLKNEITTMAVGIAVVMIFLLIQALCIVAVLRYRTYIR